MLPRQFTISCGEKVVVIPDPSEEQILNAARIIARGIRYTFPMDTNNKCKKCNKLRGPCECKLSTLKVKLGHCKSKKWSYRKKYEALLERHHRLSDTYTQLLENLRKSDLECNDDYEDEDASSTKVE